MSNPVSFDATLTAKPMTRADRPYASTCAGVVASGGCDARPRHFSAASLDPADACQDAIEAGLLVHRAYPLNVETSVPDLKGGAVMPNCRFYLRDHFDIPMLDGESYRLSVGGLVEIVAR